MNPRTRIELGRDATVAVIGGGPAGAFFALHLLKRARQLGRPLKVTVFERRQLIGAGPTPPHPGCWHGCNYCAGGISPQLNDVLRDLDITLPDEVIQSRISSITIQGFWKNIELEVPPGRKMLSVYRGSRPAGRPDSEQDFDSFLLDKAREAGAVVINGEVVEVHYSGNGKPLLSYRSAGVETRVEADFVVFAPGVNDPVGIAANRGRMIQSLQRLIPGFVPPRLRRALIFELEAKPAVPPSLAGTVHFVEYGSKTLQLEMCSLVPKRGFITVVLVGASIDAAADHGEVRDLMKRFVELPHIRKLIPPGVRLGTACVCRPNMVVGSAREPFGHRVAVVGDLVTARLYKDGILSAHQTARVLAESILTQGIDAQSLRQGYGPALRRFRRDNGFASLVFLVHGLFFGSSVLSRVLYQAVITERKTTPLTRRHLEKLLWRTASGDDAYASIFFEMIHPATVWAVVMGGAVVTLRNFLTEIAFGLRWGAFGRFTTGVAKEKLEEKRSAFSHLLAGAKVAVPEKLEFERMYTIKIRAAREAILAQLGRFGESDRNYFRPRWVRIQRIAGTPNTPGCVVRYEVAGHLDFSLIMEQIVDGHLLVYRVRDGFASGGVLIFEIETLNEEMGALSIYVAFNFTRGRRWFTRPLWRLLRLLFPAFVHDVIWNHSLCQLKSSVESSGETAESVWQDRDLPRRCPG